jgi:hypothetical protein
MKKQITAIAMLCLAAVGMVMIPFSCLAQTGSAAKLAGIRAASPRTPDASHQTKTPGSPSYTYTVINFPGSLFTYAVGMNLGAASSKTEIVGGYGLDVGITPAGFLARVSPKKTVTEIYQTVKYSHAPAQQAAQGINDSGQIVGTFVDSSGDFHGYERSGGKFSQIDVPFEGASETIPSAINNSGEVVGGYSETHGFTLIGGTYTSFDYPGAIETEPFALNSAGDIVGSYTDTGGVGHAFSLSAGTYTSIDFPGAVETFASGINDGGDIVGTYCLTGECISTFEGAQGFLFSKGGFTTIAIPGEFYTEALGINNNGVVVGFYQDAAGLVVSFLATP